MCPTAWSTKGTTQVILHMLLSCFFNTCTLCLCHPVLLSDINLWHTDNQVRVSIYRATVNIQEVFLTFYKESIFHRFWLVKFIMVFTAGNRECHELFCCNQRRRPLVDRKMLPIQGDFWTAVSLSSSLNLVSIVPMDNTMVSGDVAIRGRDLKLNPCA